MALFGVRLPAHREEDPIFPCSFFFHLAAVVIKDSEHFLHVFGVADEAELLAGTKEAKTQTYVQKALSAITPIVSHISHMNPRPPSSYGSI